MNSIKELFLIYPVESLFNTLTKDLKFKKTEYPNIIRCFNNKHIFEYNEKSNFLWCSYYNYWKLFNDFNLKDIEIKNLTKYLIEKCFKIYINNTNKDIRNYSNEWIYSEGDPYHKDNIYSCVFCGRNCQLDRIIQPHKLPLSNKIWNKNISDILICGECYNENYF
jgi:hypothetical protein